MQWKYAKKLQNCRIFKLLLKSKALQLQTIHSYHNFWKWKKNSENWIARNSFMKCTNRYIIYLQDQIEICKWKRTHIVKTLKKFFLFWLQKSIWNFDIIFSWFPVKPFLSSSFDIFLSRVTNWECFKEWLSVKNIQFFSKLLK